MIKTIITFFFFIQSINSICQLSLSQDPLTISSFLTCVPPTNIFFYPSYIIVSETILDYKMLNKLPNQDIQGFGTPIVANIPDAPTHGGYIDFIGLFFLKKAENITLNVVADNLSFKYDPISDQVIYTIKVNRGYCTYYFIGKIFNYQKASVDSYNYGGNFTLNGSNLNGITVSLNDIIYTTKTIIQTNSITYIGNDTTATMEFDNLNYGGEWEIIINQCNSIIKSFNVKNEISNINLSDVPSNGGILTITGRYITPRPGQTVSVRLINSLNENIIKDCVVTNFNSNPPPLGELETITCTLPPRSSKNVAQTVNITVNRLTKLIPGFYYDQPKILSCEQDEEYIDNKDAMFIIIGEKFPNKNPIVKVFNSTGYVYIKEFKFTQNGASSDTYSGIIEVKIPINAVPGSLSLLFDQGLDSEIESSTYSPFFITPKITNISGCNTDGGIVTIYGSSLYIINYRNETIENSFIKINGIGCESFKNGDGSLITCVYVPGVGKNHNVLIKINGIEYNNLMFSYNAPSITDINQNFTSDIITILGSNFGDSNETAVVKFGDEQVNILSITHQAITVEIQNHFYGNYTIHTLIGNHDQAQDTDRPFIGPVLPIITSTSNIDASGGIVNITGKYLNKDMYITFKKEGTKRRPIPCISVQTFNNRLAQCKVIGRNGQDGNSTTYTSGSNFTVYVENGKRDGYADNTIFSFNPPIITSVGKATIALFNSKQTISIVGKGFNRNGLKVYVGNDECKLPYIYLEFTGLSCVIPSLESIGVRSIDNFTEWNNKIVKFNITVDGLSSTFESNLYNFNVNIPLESKGYGYLAAVAVCGLVGAGTIISIVVYKYNRYKRIKKIKLILKKPFGDANTTANHAIVSK